MVELRNMKVCIISWILIAYSGVIYAGLEQAFLPCPRGWDTTYDGASVCTQPMAESNTVLECIRKGGVPGAMIMLDNTDNGVGHQAGRRCIDDLKAGDFSINHNLKAYMKSLRKTKANE